MTNDPALMHLQTSALSVDCPGCDTPERLMVVAEMVSAQGIGLGDMMKCGCGRLAKWSTYQADWWCPVCCLRVAAPGSEPKTFIAFGI